MYKIWQILLNLELKPQKKTRLKDGKIIRETVGNVPLRENKARKSKSDKDLDKVIEQEQEIELEKLEEGESRNSLASYAGLLPTYHNRQPSVRSLPKTSPSPKPFADTLAEAMADSSTESKERVTRQNNDYQYEPLPEYIPRHGMPTKEPTGFVQLYNSPPVYVPNSVTPVIDEPQMYYPEKPKSKQPIYLVIHDKPERQVQLLVQYFITRGQSPMTG